MLLGSLERLGAHRLTGPALDDRAGCAVLVALLHRLAGAPLPVQLTVAFTAQEEIGTRGARYLAHRLEADTLITVDTGVAEDTPDTPERGLRLGRGPGIKRLDAGAVAHPAVWRLLLRLAETLGLPHQLVARQVGATDARELQLVGPTGGISLPCRYTHSPVEVVDLRDLEAALALLEAVVRKGIAVA